MWAEQLARYAQSGALQEEQSYWLDLSRWPGTALPVDFPDGANTAGSVRVVTVTLSMEETEALLRQVPSVYNTQIQDALLTALAEGFSTWTGSPQLVVDLEGHGREEVVDGVDLSRTVGWFTTIFPVVVEQTPGARPEERLKAIKEQLRAIPTRGIGYGLLRYLSGEREVVEQLKSTPAPKVSFNYLGQFDQELSDDRRFGAATGPQGAWQSAKQLRRHLLDINGWVRDGRLSLQLSYSENVHRRQTIDELARGVMEALQALIAACQAAEVGGATPSDFPEAKLDQQQLDKFMAEFTRSQGK
jgi:non-ribosomal peptide synthase protein (TIGR01720 family)